MNNKTITISEDEFISVMSDIATACAARLLLDAQNQINTTASLRLHCLICVDLVATAVKKLFGDKENKESVDVESKEEMKETQNCNSDL